MMFEFILSVIIFLILIISLSWIISESKKKKKQLFDFYAMFLMGLSWIVIGIFIKNNVLITTGILFTIVGFYHKKEWDKETHEWHNLEKHEKKEVIEMLVILFCLSLLGIVGYLLVKGFLN